MRRALRICGLLALLATPALALASGSGKQVWVTNCSREQYKPSMIVIACGDAGTFVKNLKWTAWSPTGATGTGTEYVNKCSPNCAAGHYKKTEATVTLSKPIGCSKQKHRVFDRLKMKFRGVSGPHSTETDSLGCPLK